MLRNIIQQPLRCLIKTIKPSNLFYLRPFLDIIEVCTANMNSGINNINVYKRTLLVIFGKEDRQASTVTACDISDIVSKQ